MGQSVSAVTCVVEKVASEVVETTLIAPPPGIADGENDTPLGDGSESTFFQSSWLWIVVACGILLLCCCCVILAICRRRKKKKPKRFGEKPITPKRSLPFMQQNPMPKPQLLIEPGAMSSDQGYTQYSPRTKISIMSRIGLGNAGIDHGDLVRKKIQTGNALELVDLATMRIDVHKSESDSQSRRRSAKKKPMRKISEPRISVALEADEEAGLKEL